MATIILGDIVEVIKETVHNPQESGFQYFVGLEHYDSGEPLITRYATPDNLTSSVKHFAKGDILVARRNVYLKRASLVDFEGVTSGDSIVLRAKDNKYQQILPFILNSDDFWDYAEQNSDGTMSKRLSPADLLDYEFEEPENIELLADKLWAAYRVKESYKKLLAATDDMLKAKFQEMFGEEKYRYATIQDISYQLLAGGDAPKDIIDKPNGDYHYPVYANGEGERGIIGWAKTYKISKDAITIAARGLVGYCAIRKACFTPVVRLITIVPKEYINLTYLLFALNNKKFHITGGAQKQLTIPNIQKELIPIPPILLQQKFAEIATQAEATKESLRKSIENIDQVIKSLINQ